MSDDSTRREPSRYARIGKYDVLSHIATGGVCAVYKGIDTELGREVALKVLPPTMAEKAETLERFRREARHGARLHHENVVALYDFGESAGTYFLALEFVDGIDLLAYINELGMLEPKESLSIIVQAARALDHLHKFGLVHRDVKPGNFLMTRRNGEWHVKLTDLGLARLRNDADFRITKDGFTVGTLDYMSPEQARDSGSVDIRSDIYALGCTWYHMLAGRPPFGEGGLAERLLRHFESTPPDIRRFNPKVTPAMTVVLLRMLAKKPIERYQNPAELLVDLERLQGLAAPAKAETKPSLGEDNKGTTDSSADLVDVGPDTDPEISVSLAETAISGLTISAELRQAAAGQFARAKQVIAAGNLDYGIHLLLSCCKIHPGNLVYRRVLRRAAKARLKNKNAAGALAFLTVSRDRTRVKAAKTINDHLGVLEAGEELLVRNPYDIGVQLDMAASAETLGATELALWILRHAYDKKSPDARVTRALATLYEKLGRLNEAITFWKLVVRADPLDMEAARKPNDLAAADTIIRGDYDKESRR
jgi:serine/threonine protein kinase